MVESPGSLMLVIASRNDQLAGCRVWGTGGWMPHTQREALDWFTLGRLLGWHSRLAFLPASELGETGMTALAAQWVVLACDPETVTQQLVEQLESLLTSHPAMVIVRASAISTPMSRLCGAARSGETVRGQALQWTEGAGVKSWTLRKSIDGYRLSLTCHNEIWATLDDAPLIVARRVGLGVVVTLAFHPSLARDTDGSATALIRHLLIFGSPTPVAWIDFSNALILRMDDPGAAQNLYLRSWSYTELGAAQWKDIQTELQQRDARLSIAYTPGWVDDGNAVRGTLTVRSRITKREPGRVHPSPLVQYLRHADGRPKELNDYQGEYLGIRSLCAQGLGDVELHGYTHMHPDTTAWATAPDRYDEVSWYRELGPAAQAVISRRPVKQHPLVLGLALLKEYFGSHPTTLVCPGDEWTNEALALALDLGLQLVDSYYLALRDGNRFCWVTHVCSPYLNEPDASWFDAGLPVVGYFHDREPAIEGVGWIAKCLDAWREAGVERFIDFREFATAMGRRLGLAKRGDGLHLSVTNDAELPLVRPLAVMLRNPACQLPQSISAFADGRDLELLVERQEVGVGRVFLRPSASSRFP